MFENIGGKIKGLTKFIFALGVIACCISGITFLCARQITVGLIVLIGGPILCWISSFIMFGFGQLIEDAHAIKEKMYEGGRIKEEREFKKTIAKEKESIKEKINDNVDGDTIVEITCPQCKNALSFFVRDFIESNSVKCPYCDSDIDVQPYKKN